MSRQLADFSITGDCSISKHCFTLTNLATDFLRCDWAYWDPLTESKSPQIHGPHSLITAGYIPEHKQHWSVPLPSYHWFLTWVSFTWPLFKGLPGVICGEHWKEGRICILCSVQLHAGYMTLNESLLHRLYIFLHQKVKGLERLILSLILVLPFNYCVTLIFQMPMVWLEEDLLKIRASMVPSMWLK